MPSALRIKELRDLNDNVMMSDGALTSGVTFPAGHVVQVKYTSDKTRRLFSGRTSNTWYSDYTYLNTTITPIYSDSLLFVQCNIMYYGSTDTNTSTGSIFLRMMMNGSICPELNGDTNQSLPCFSQSRSVVGDVSDLQYHTQIGACSGLVPASGLTTKTFSVEYRLQSGGRISINRDPSTATDYNQGSHSPTGISTLTIMEIKQ